MDSALAWWRRAAAGRISAAVMTVPPGLQQVDDFVQAETEPLGRL
jgi:hypothetical protein